MLAIGDELARVLSIAGITKRRVAWLLGLKDCGCDKRQSQINAAGFVAQTYVFNLMFSCLARLSRVEAFRRIRGASQFFAMGVRLLATGRT